MKRIFILTLMFLSFFTISWAEEISSVSFKYSMHKIFDSYNHVRISISLAKFEIADIHLRDLNESIAEAEKNIPEENRDGSKQNCPGPSPRK